MSLNTVIAFALLLKKITRKGNIGKKHPDNTNKKMRKPFYNSSSNNADNNNNKNKNKNKDKNKNKVQISLSSSSEEEDDDNEEEEEEDEEEITVLDYNQDLSKKKKSNSSSLNNNKKEKHSSLNDIIHIATTTTTQQEQLQLQRASMVLLLPSSNNNTTQDVKRISPIIVVKEEEEEEEDCDDDTGTIASLKLMNHETDEAIIEIIVRDFAYPTDSPLHFGKSSSSSSLVALKKSLKNKQSTISLSSPDFNGRDARALFDFSPETEYEIGLKAGQTIWVQYRQCQGWLIADVQDETGLIPESYVEFI